MTTDSVHALDDAVRMQAIDKRNMLRLINELPEQCETALGMARGYNIDALDVHPACVFFTGVGDSGLAADMAAAVLAEQATIPIVANHGGRLPNYVGENSLVIVVDYSGKNQSEIRCLREAKRRGARVICVTSGGKLLEEAVKEEIKTIKVPPGQLHRLAIGYLFVPLIVIAEKLGIVQGQIEKLSHAIKLMKNVREGFRFENPLARNIAKQTAQALFQKLVVIYGASDYREAVACRWKTQIDANSKRLAFAGAFLDLAICEMSGWESVSDRPNEFGIVILRDPEDRGEIADLIEASEKNLEPFGVIRVDTRGASAMEKLLYGVYMGDFVSYYLALLNGNNPSATENVSLMESSAVSEAES